MLGTMVGGQDKTDTNISCVYLLLTPPIVLGVWSMILVLLLQLLATTGRAFVFDSRTTQTSTTLLCTEGTCIPEGVRHVSQST